MFTSKDKNLIYDNYFEIIRETEDFFELLSRNTKHCWIIQKHHFKDTKGIYLYHKHHEKDKYYHKHWQTYNVQMAIDSIKRHDAYVLSPIRKYAL